MSYQSYFVNKEYFKFWYAVLEKISENFQGSFYDVAIQKYDLYLWSTSRNKNKSWRPELDGGDISKLADFH